MRQTPAVCLYNGIIACVRSLPSLLFICLHAGAQNQNLACAKQDLSPGATTPLVNLTFMEVFAFYL